MAEGVTAFSARSFRAGWPLLSYTDVPVGWRRLRGRVAALVTTLEESASRRCAAFITLMTTAPAAIAETSEIVHYGMGALLIVQTLLIIALFIQNRRQRAVKKDVERLQAEVAHAARLAIAGEISASIAHEVAQPLSAILSNVETAELLLRQRGGSTDEIVDILADIKRDDLRAYEIVRRMRLLLQKRQMQFETLDLNVLIANTVSMLRSDASRRRIQLRTELAELPSVRVDAVHLQQVILNLLLNAMDALARTPPSARTILIRTGISERSGVEIVISDTGRGMTTEHLARAFESFFTTKEGGMGLGLSIAKSIVQAHGGTITAESIERSGTTFRITLPTSAGKAHVALAASLP